MEYLLIAVNIGFGYVIGFILRILRYPKPSIIKDILFSIFYIVFYIKLIDSFIIETNLYLLSFVLTGFLIGYKYYYKKSISDFHLFFLWVRNKLFFLLKPPIILSLYYSINKRFKKHLEKKKHPYLKKSPYELF